MKISFTKNPEAFKFTDKNFEILLFFGKIGFGIKSRILESNLYIFKGFRYSFPGNFFHTYGYK